MENQIVPSKKLFLNSDQGKPAGVCSESRQEIRGLEEHFDGELAGTRAADLIERVQYTEPLVERLCGRAETGELVHEEHWMVEEVAVLRPQEQARTLGEMKLAAQGKVGLVDGKSAEEVAREVALPARRRGREGSRVAATLRPGSPGAGR